MPAIDPDELPKKKVSHEMGQDLALLSVGELSERIGLLKEEIARLEAEMARNAPRKRRRAPFSRNRALWPIIAGVAAPWKVAKVAKVEPQEDFAPFCDSLTFR